MDMSEAAIERISNPDQGTLDLILAFEAVLPQLQHVLDFEGATLFVAEEQGLRAVSGYRLPYFQHIRDTHVPWRNPLIQELLQRREALVLADVDADPRFVKNDPQVTLHSWIGVPIFLEDRLAGLLSINH
ncbi:MAG: GAF domain-containing protein, partial [Caldilineae bacterium]